MDEIKYIVACLNNGEFPNNDIGIDLEDYINALAEYLQIEAQDKKYVSEFSEYGTIDSDNEQAIINIFKLEKESIVEALDRFIDISEEDEGYLLANLKYEDYYFVQYWYGIVCQYTDETYWDGIYFDESAARQAAQRLIPTGYFYNKIEYGQG